MEKKSKRVKYTRKLKKVGKTARRLIKKAKPKVRYLVQKAKAKLRKIDKKRIQTELRKAKAKLRIAKVKAMEADRKISAYATKNPEKALAIAIAAGYVIGRAVGALKRRR